MLHWCLTGLGDWDVVDRCDIPSPGKIDLLGSQDRLVNKLTDRLSNLLGPGRTLLHWVSDVFEPVQLSKLCHGVHNLLDFALQYFIDY